MHVEPFIYRVNLTKRKWNVFELARSASKATVKRRTFHAPNLMQINEVKQRT